nr:iron chelate uptake ABC transporter family permease subunit [Streptomyces erythrochromogenes]
MNLVGLGWGAGRGGRTGVVAAEVVDAGAVDAGTTAGADVLPASDVVPLTVVLAVGVFLAVQRRADLDLVSLDEDTPRLLGLDPARGRPAFLLSATAVAAAGTIGFVGLVAPHAARALVGRRHVRVVPVAVLLDAVLVCTADLVGRTVIAPTQIGAGLMTALIGTPYFLHLLVRSRSR